MNNAYFMLGDFQVYYSSVVITAGIFLCWVMTLYLYWRSGRNTAAVHVFAVFAFVLSVIISRFLHWYFNSESYSSFLSAMTDYSYGSYALPGMLIAIWISAVLVKKTGLARYAGKLLDCAAPGVCLLIAFIRLSALFNNTCKGKMIIKNESFQFLPIAYPVADAAGNISYRFATFFVQFLVMLVVALLVWNLYFKQQSTKMRKPCPKTGNVARLAMVFYGAVEIIADSTRYDSPLMHLPQLPPPLVPGCRGEAPWVGAPPTAAPSSEASTVTPPSLGLGSVPFLGLSPSGNSRPPPRCGSCVRAAPRCFLSLCSNSHLEYSALNP